MDHHGHDQAMTTGRRKSRTIHELLSLASLKGWIMDELSSPALTTIVFETLDGDTFRIGEMRHPVAILTFLRYVG